MLVKKKCEEVEIEDKDRFLKEKIIILSIFILTSSSSLFAVFNLYNEENKK